MPLPKRYKTCYFCRKTVSQKETPSIFILSNHMRIHTRENPFPCPFPSVCKRSFRTLRRQVVHRLTHENSGEKPWKCETCPASFRTQIGLSSHKIDVHTTERKFKCTMCPSSYKRATHLHLHLKDHDPFNKYKCPNCDYMLKTARSLKSHIVNMHGKRDSKCYFCKKTFNPKGLIAHMRTHTEEVPFKCKECPQTGFRHSSTLSQHQAKEHPSNNNPYKPGPPVHHQCPHCPNSYRTKSSLYYHLGCKHGETDKLAACYRDNKCRICAKKCKDVHALGVHIRTHTKEKPYRCEKRNCGKDFASSNSLNSHLKSCLKRIEGDFKCRFCPKTFIAAKNALFHETNVHEETWARPKRCLSCPKVFPSHSALERHALIHSKEAPFKCPHCSRAYFRDSDYTKHLRRIHNAKPIKIKQEVENPFTCKICSKSFKYIGGLMSHQEVHQDPQLQCPKCELKFHTVKLLKKHNQANHEDPRHKCYFCSRYFNKSQSLNNHILIHTDEFPFKCELCKKSFRTLTGLKSHTEVNHNVPGLKMETTFFPCAKCPHKIFSAKHQLKNHTYRVHTKTWNQKLCPFCGKLTRDSYALNVHMSCHTGEKPHKCTICGEGFRQRGTYLSHIQQHEDRQKGIKFPCSICGKLYLTRYSLGGHIFKMHSGKGRNNKCYFCPETYTRKESMIAHMRSKHTMERVHICEECPLARFLNKTKLNHHRFQLHPHLCYECPHCRKVFKSKSELSIHSKCHLSRGETTAEA